MKLRLKIPFIGFKRSLQCHSCTDLHHGVVDVLEAVADSDQRVVRRFILQRRVVGSGRELRDVVVTQDVARVLDY